MYANYHTHTFRCGHAANVPDAVFVEKAIESGVKILGFSDHSPWPYPNGFTNRSVRMNAEELDGYIDSIHGLRERYAGRITIYTGLECEYFPAYMDWLNDTKRRLDFLILGNHFAASDEHGEINFAYAKTVQHVRDYKEYTIKGMETGLFRYLAHPDIVLANYPVFDDACEEMSYELCEKAKALNLPLEYNLLGIEKRRKGISKGLGYPCPDFWRIAALCRCTAIIGIDAHDPNQFFNIDIMHEADRDLRSLGIATIDTLEGLT